MSYLYHPYYCEENIWHLCQRPEFSHSKVLVIASKDSAFPMLQQRTAAAPYVPLFWDYHVIMLWHDQDQQSHILDFDTTLGFCTPVKPYFQQSFMDEKHLPPAFIPLFRVIPAKTYATCLQSDRRHMKTGQNWLAPPPAWPAISATTSNLHKFTDMTDHDYGQIMTAAELLQHCQQLSETKVEFTRSYRFSEKGAV